jgi:hypothetical protein
MRRRNADLREGFNDEIEMEARKVVAAAVAKGADPNTVIEHLDSDEFVDAVAAGVRSRIRQLQDGSVVEDQREQNRREAGMEGIREGGPNGEFRDGHVYELPARDQQEVNEYRARTAPGTMIGDLKAIQAHDAHRSIGVKDEGPDWFKQIAKRRGE